MEHAPPTMQLVRGLKSLVATLQDKNGSAVCRKTPDDFRTNLLQCKDGRSSYCETDLQLLSDAGCFETVMWLLLNRSLPDPEQLADAASLLFDGSAIDRPLAETISSVPLQTRPLDLLPLSISLLSCFAPGLNDTSIESSRSQFWQLLAQLPVLLHAAFGGDLEGGKPVFSPGCSDPEIAGIVDQPATSWAGRLLQVLREDHRPVSAAEEHAMNVLMTCQCITDDRAADQSARFVGASVTDIAAAWKASSAVYASQLRNDPYQWTSSLMQRFENPSHAQQWWQSRNGKAMPFGFSDQPECDRSIMMRSQCEHLLGSVPAMVMEASCSRLEAVLAQENRFPTADWTATRLLTLLGVSEDRISVAIGMARLVGWAAHHLDAAERGSSD